MTVGTEAHFRSVLYPARARVLVSALERSADEARQLTIEKRFAEARTEPTVAFDLATRILDAEFAGRPGITKGISQNQILWVVDGIYAIRVKRLDMAYQSSNHVSSQQSLISGQLRLPGMPPLIFVCAGTRYSELTGLPLDYVVVKHYPGTTTIQEVEWVVDLRDLAEGDGTTPVAPVFPFTPAPASPQVIVRPARAHRATPTADEQRDRPTSN